MFISFQLTNYIMSWVNIFTTNTFIERWRENYWIFGKKFFWNFNWMSPKPKSKIFISMWANLSQICSAKTVSTRTRCCPMMKLGSILSFRFSFSLSFSSPVPSSGHNAWHGLVCCGMAAVAFVAAVAAWLTLRIRNVWGFAIKLRIVVVAVRKLL